jgi:hypothetical protein
MGKVAMPLPLSVAVPSGVAPSKNVTVPVAPAGVTVAVNVTSCPNTVEVGEPPTEVLVAVRARA